MKQAGFDIIGDVHGYADKLVSLLNLMGYSELDGTWRHPTRQAVFVGDLIDRGPRQVETIQIVKPMVEAGYAKIVAGNHEFNAIAWHAGRREKSDKNRSQHQHFLTEIGEGSADHTEAIEWFMAQPLWLDLGDLRVVHACWDPSAIVALQPQTGPANQLTRELVQAATQKGSPEFDAVEILLKGPEVELHPNPAYLDKGGHTRKRARWCWWNPSADNLKDGALIPGDTTTPEGDPYPELPDSKLDLIPVAPYRDEVPAFFGHYWHTRTPEPTSLHTACVDYSAGNGGPLVAYRWTGESELRREAFVVAD